MANLPIPQNPGFPGVFQVETTTPWVGGLEGTANQQARQLLERTEYLKGHTDAVETAIDEAKEGMPSLKDRIDAIGSSPKSLYKKDFVQDAPLAASTENVDVVTGGLLVIDGIQTAAGDLVFLKDQTDPKENGFWKVQTGAWNRFDGYTDGETGCFTQKLIDVNSGTENKGLIFVLEADAYIIGQTALNFRQTYLSSAKKPSTALFRNRTGRVEELEGLTPNGYGMYREGRNLLEVLGVATPAEAMDILCGRLNNGVSAANGEADFTGLQIGDYIPGIDLSAIPAENGGDAGQAYDATYRNNDIVLSGFNTYLGAGDTENTKNHLLWTFKNAPLRKRVNATDTNTGGYVASDLRAFLEGAAGDGTGAKSGITTAAFMNALSTQIGGHLYTIRKGHSNKSNSAWASYTVFPPSELEVFGFPTYGDEGVYLVADTATSSANRAGWNTNVQFPIFASSYKHRIKRYNGARMWWWESTPSGHSAAAFAHVNNNGNSGDHDASSVGGCAPAFCVA